MADNAKANLTGISNLLTNLTNVAETARDYVYLEEYFTEMFSCYTTGKGSEDLMSLSNEDMSKNKFFGSEMEYILYGKDTVEGNLNSANYYYIDLKGNKKLIGDNTYQFLGSFGCGLAPAQRDGKYGYIDTDFNEKKFEYEYAGAFANDIAAVKKDGKWALINTELETITDFDYDEIIVDSNGFCSVYDVIIARQGDKYLFLDHKGRTIGKETFDGASIAASNDSYIAIKKGDLWGFANTKGEIVIEPIYEGAKSFSMGMAPVKVEDRWGYINIEGKLVIETKYFEAGVFSEDGAAPVKDSSVWDLIVLCEYDN